MKPPHDAINSAAGDNLPVARILDPQSPIPSDPLDWQPAYLVAVTNGQIQEARLRKLNVAVIGGGVLLVFRLPGC